MPAGLQARGQPESAQQRADATRAAGLPSLGLAASYYQNTRSGEAVTSTDTQETTVGLILTVPIFDGFSSTYKLRGAQARVEQKEAALADARQERIRCLAEWSSARLRLLANTGILGKWAVTK